MSLLSNLQANIQWGEAQFGRRPQHLVLSRWWAQWLLQEVFDVPLTAGLGTMPRAIYGLPVYYEKLPVDTCYEIYFRT
jgi:hypothetical protein